MCFDWLIDWLFYLHFIYKSLVGNSDSLTCARLQQQQEQRHPVLRVHAGSFRVSVIPSGSGIMDYRIFNVRTSSFLCRRINTDSESAQHFWLGKAHNLFVCSWRGSNSGLRSIPTEDQTCVDTTQPSGNVSSNSQTSMKLRAVQAVVTACQGWWRDNSLIVFVFDYFQPKIEMCVHE